MKIEVISSRELGGDVVREWAAIQESQPMLASPFFSPGFTAAVGSVRDNVRIAILRGAGDRRSLPIRDERSGQWPGDRRAGLRFPGDHLPPHLGISAEALVAGCGLSRWSFTHLIAQDDTFQSFRSSAFDSPFIDLTGGFARYRAGASRPARSSCGRLSEDAANSNGRSGSSGSRSARVTWRLRATMRLKSEQYRRTGSYDRFAIGWIAALLERLLEGQCADFGGMLSVLSTGGRLVAAHFGMASRSVLNWWFPVYDVAFARYSPARSCWWS